MKTSLLSLLVVVVAVISGRALADGEHLVVFTKNKLNPNYVAFRLGADRAAARLGAQTIHRVPDKPDDAPEQIALLEATVREKPGAILLAPADDKALEPMVAQINKAGIPLLGFVNKMAVGDFVSFVGSNDEEMGYQTARYLLQHMGGKGSVVVVEGPSTAPTSRDRVIGFKRALAEYPGIRLLGSADGRYQTADAELAMTKLLAEHSEIDGVIAANDSMAIGVLAALDRAGRKAHVVGLNGTIEAARAIENGRMLASEDYSGLVLGCLTAEAAIRHLRGQPVPKEIMLPVRIIDRANVAEWLIPVEQRSCPDWDTVVRGNG
jgi:ribose transport system substrate-binding protein